MKYVVQIVVPCIVWFLAQSMGGRITLESANLYLKGANIFLFLLAAAISFVGYVTFVQREVKSDKKVCYTKAEWSCILGTFLSLSYAYTAWEWIKVIKGGYSSPAHIDILYSVNDAAFAVIMILNCELLNNVFFRKSFLPFGKIIPHRKKSLNTAIDLGFISEDQKDEILKIQKKENENDD